MKKLEVVEVYEGKSKDFTDVVVYEGDKKYVYRDMPYLDKKGKEISYDDALTLYGKDGLSDGIWSDEKYIRLVEEHINDNDIEKEEI